MIILFKIKSIMSSSCGRKINKMVFAQWYGGANAIIFIQIDATPTQQIWRIKYQHGDNKERLV